jgi:protein SCO1/2
MRWLIPGIILVGAVAFGWYIGSRAGSDQSKSSHESGGGLYRNIAGRVVRVAPEEGVLTVDHEEIEGFMQAMVMDLKAADPRELENLKPGDNIRFDLARIGGTYRVVRIRRIAEGEARSETAAPTPPVDPLGRGDLVPDLVLVNTSGERFRLRGMEPRHKVITFFYVRCPLENFCPAQSRRLAEMQQHIQRSQSGVHLLSLTLDSEHDTPAMLAAYAQRFQADPGQWTFAAGEQPEAIRDFAHRAGAQIQARSDSFQIDHALVALRVDGDRIVDRVYGLDAIENLLRQMR